MSDTTAYRWHVGSNVPGYSPESDITCHESATGARDALVSELERTRDTFEGECVHSVVAEGCESCSLYAAVEDIIANARTADVTEGYSASVNIGRALPLIHWVDRIHPDEFGGHADCNPDN